MAIDASSLSPDVLKNLVSAVSGGSTGGIGGLLGGAASLLGAAKGDITTNVISAVNAVLSGGGVSDIAKSAFTSNILQGIPVGDVAKKLGISESEVTSNVGSVLSLIKAQFAKKA